MIVLDHNIPEDQAEQLRRWRVHFRQIGFEVVNLYYKSHFVFVDFPRAVTKKILSLHSATA